MCYAHWGLANRESDLQTAKPKLRLHAPIHPLAARLAVLEHGQRRIRSLLIRLLKMEIKNMATLKDLLTKVTAVDDAAVAFKTLDDGLKAQITDLQAQLAAALAAPAQDQATIDAINAKLDAANATLAGAAAVVANTPVAAP
jgi:dGTP triphosphohydrolase